jgi:hypothetical protein
MKSLLRLNGDRVLAVALVVLGVVVLVIGWFGISGKALAVQQLPYLISGGLGGVVLVAVGCTLAISADLQDEWRQMERVEQRLVELVGKGSEPEADPSVNANGSGRVARRATDKAAP